VTLFTANTTEVKSTSFFAAAAMSGHLAEVTQG
jgi:hypothetical protein